MWVTLFGMVKEVKDEQPQKAPIANVLTDSGMVSDVSAVQPKNVSLLMASSLFERAIDFSAEQLWNAHPPK